MLFADRIRHHARGRPAAIAVEDPTRRLTFAEFDRLVDRAAGGLRRAGAGPGTHVGLTLPRSVRTLALIYALERIGAPYLTLGVDEGERERAALLSAARIDVHLSTAATIDSAVAVGIVPDRSWWSTASAETVADPPIEDSAPCYFSRSSGTTGGQPKLVLWSRAYFARRRMGMPGFAPGPGTRFLSLVDLSFNVGLRFVARTLDAGGTVVIPPPLHAGMDFGAYVRAARANASFLVPTMLRILADPARGAVDLSDLQPLIVGTGLLTQEERRRFRATMAPGLAVSFGINEVGGIFMLAPNHPAMDRPGSVGPPVEGMEVEIIGEDGRPVPPGATGRLRVRAPGMPQTIYGGGATGGFHDGWFLSGDLMMIDETGCAHFRGRLDDQIDVGGRKVQPVDVETVIAAHPDVAEVAVVGERTARGEVPVAFVVLRRAIPAGELRQYCADRLARHAIPRRFTIVDALPRNDVGKVLRRRLRDPTR